MAGAKSSSHVPKFGNWDTDDVPYTICFQNASQLRAAGVTFDPNDPDTYPAAAIPKSIPAGHRRAIASLGSEKLSSERSSSDYSLLKEAKQSGGRKKNTDNNDGISRFPPTAVGHGGNPRVRRNKEGEVIASVPKFGSWDARDPKSGDGYTAIFNKVKIEKQIAASNPKTVPPLTNQTKQPVAYTTKSHGFTSFASKICCCLCPK